MTRLKTITGHRAPQSECRKRCGFREGSRAGKSTLGPTFTPARTDQTGCHSGVCRALQSAASFRLHDSEEIADMKIAVEFGLFLARQFALASQLRQFVHACD